MFTPLVTFICYVPLKRKILFHLAYLALPFLYEIGLGNKRLPPKKSHMLPMGYFPSGTHFGKNLERFTYRPLRMLPEFLPACLPLRMRNPHCFHSIQLS